jgi:hypothetical protein
MPGRDFLRPRDTMSMVRWLFPRILVAGAVSTLCDSKILSWAAACHGWSRHGASWSSCGLSGSMRRMIRVRARRAVLVTCLAVLCVPLVTLLMVMAHETGHTVVARLLGEGYATFKIYDPVASAAICTTRSG